MIFISHFPYYNVACDESESLMKSYNWDEGKPNWSLVLHASCLSTPKFSAKMWLWNCMPWGVYTNLKMIGRETESMWKGGTLAVVINSHWIHHFGYRTSMWWMHTIHPWLWITTSLHPAGTTDTSESLGIILPSNTCTGLWILTNTRLLCFFMETQTY